MKNRHSFCFPARDIMRLSLMFVGLLWLGVLVIRAADTHYVSLGGDNTSPYTNGWASAATEIQWAVDAATASDTVLVSNGTYNLTNQISITNSIIVKSLYGTNDAARLAIINGNYPFYTNRCVYMTNGILDGFTISNGFASGISGGGIYLTNATVINCFIYKNYCSNSGAGLVILAGGTASNCTIVSNTAAGAGGAGGVYLSGGLIVDSRVSGNIASNNGGMNLQNGALATNCVVTGNRASYNYGGISIISGSKGANCIISNNAAYDVGGVRVNDAYLYNSVIINNTSSHYYGGAYIENGSVVSNCQIIGNSTANFGGGIYVDGAWGSRNTVLSYCTIIGNTSGPQGSALDLRYGGSVRNCLISGNTTLGGGSVVNMVRQLGSYAGSYGIINCTIAGNSGIGLRMESVTGYVDNCIIYSNTVSGASADMFFDTGSKSDRCWHVCTSVALAPNQGNITNNPLFVNSASGDYRLSANSPSINTGTNQSWMTNSYDLDGRTRIRYGTVDMGAYERINEGTIYKLW